MADQSKLEKKKLRRAKNAVRGAFNRPKAPYFEAINRWGRTKHSAADLILGGISKLGPSEAKEFMEWIQGFPSKAVQIFPTQPVQRPKELALELVKVGMPLLTRLNWLSNLLTKSADDIRLFVDLKARFEKSFLFGQFEDSQVVLDEVRSKFGFSVWFIEVEIALLQRWKGLDAQKEFFRSISSTSRGRLAGVSSYWISQRNEENTVFSRFRTRLERGIKNWKVEESLQDAYAIILGVKNFEDFTDARASFALGALATTSLIDAYNAVILALETIFMASQWPVATDMLNEIVSRLPDNDPRVRNMSALLSGQYFNLPKASTDLIDRFFRSENVASSATSDSFDASALVDIVYFQTAGGEGYSTPWAANPPISNYFEIIKASIVRPPGFEGEIEQGSKLLANLRHFPISSAVRGFLIAQAPEYSLGAPSRSIQFFLNSAAIHPWHALVIPTDAATEICTVGFASSPFSQKVADAISSKLRVGECKCVPINELAARNLLSRGNPVGALDYLQIDAAGHDELARRRFVPLRVIALMRSGQIEQAISTAAWACSDDSDIAALLPLRDLVDEAKDVRDKITDKLSLAILFSLYLERREDDDVFQMMQFAYEDYVLSKGVERPSELVGKCDLAETTKLTYFLRNIAVPEVMDVSFWLFKRSRDTLSERIAVCSALIQLDPFYEDEYREEIKDITKLLGVQDGLEDVDRSRVYVNFPKLQRWAESELRESFERYQALLRAGVRADESGEFDKVLKDFVAGKGTLDQFADYPIDESGQLLLDIYNSIAEKYLHDPDIGLDAYLSMRIRHGSLAGHIRGPLEEQGLLAVRDKGTNQYRMLRQPPVDDILISANDWDSARFCVETFSRIFDGLIDGLTRERLQIKGEKKPEGLFAFDPTPIIIYYLRANIHEGSTFPEFLAHVLNALHVYLSASLQNVRKYITEEFSDKIAASIEQFRVSIDQRVSPTLSGELQKLIGRISPELQASIERVASWFAPDEENERRALRTMEQIVDIAIQATNNAHRGFEPKFTLAIEDLGLQSTDTMIEITDILFTILDNIYTHSGMNRSPIIRITIESDGTQDDGGTRVRIVVANKIAAQSKTLANERRLDRIREQIESGDYRALSKVEGGTGFLKLKRIVAADNRQTLEFGYSQDAPEFVVKVTMILIFKPAVSIADASASAA